MSIFFGERTQQTYLYNTKGVSKNDKACLCNTLRKASFDMIDQGPHLSLTTEANQIGFSERCWLYQGASSTKELSYNPWLYIIVSYPKITL